MCLQPFNANLISAGNYWSGQSVTDDFYFLFFPISAILSKKLEKIAKLNSFEIVIILKTE